MYEFEMKFRAYIK